MTKEQINCEFRYQTAKYLINQMVKNEILTEKEYTKINNKLVEKYGSIFGRLDTQKPLKMA
jgi:translation initiation factor 2 alpha subunit (eIF-2alpha)